MELHTPAARTLPRCVPSNPLYRPTLARAGCAASTMRLAAVAALSIALLGACGGGEDGDERAAAAEPTTPARVASVDFTKESEYGPGDAPGSAATAAAARTASTPVAADESLADATREVIERAAVPVDRQAHTRRGRYLSRATAERHDAQTGGRIVWVDASCCAGLDPELPERIAFGMQAVLGEELPLYVSGSDLRQAARLADRLDALGLQRVYLVTP